MNPSIILEVDKGAPACTTYIKWKITAGCCTLKIPVVVDSFLTEFTIPYNNTAEAATTVILPFNLAVGSIGLVTIALKFAKENNGAVSVSKDKRWMPCGSGWRHSCIVTYPWYYL